jgi:hypothetical protein
MITHGVGFRSHLLVPMLLNGAMSMLSFYFLALNRLVRGATLFVAALFVLNYAGSLVAHFNRPFDPQCCMSQSLAWVGIVGLTIGYLLCAYLLWSALRTSNNRWSGRDS